VVPPALLSRPFHETVFALASAFFFSISYVFHRLVVECCCYGGACVFFDVEAKSKKQKRGCLVFLLACRLQSLAALLFCSLLVSLLSHRVTQVYNPSSFA
jgi:hypothetical protein